MKKEIPFFQIFLALFIAGLIFAFGQTNLIDRPVVFFQSFTHAIRSGLVATFQDLRSTGLEQSHTVAEAKDWVNLQELIQLKTENEKMRRLLQSPLPSSWKFTPARVVGISENQLVIDEGELSGIKPEMTVIAADTKEPARSGILIGKIGSVSAGQSQVLLLSHRDFKFPVEILSAKTLTPRGKGLSIGNDATAIIEEILSSEQVSANDLIVTGTGKLAPHLLVGLLTNPVLDAAGVYKSASIIPLIDVKQLDYVFVITSF